MSLETAAASARRLEPLEDTHLDANLHTLLANYQKVTSNPRSMGYLRFLIKHYAKSPTPWRDCYKDNFKRFGPKTPALCGVLKDTIRQRTDWRGKGPRPGDNPGDSPGVAIGEADKGAAKPPWGPWMHTKLSDATPLDVGDKVRRVDTIIAQFGPAGTIAKAYTYQSPDPSDTQNGTPAYDVTWDNGTSDFGMHGFQLRRVDAEAMALAIPEIPDDVWATIEDVLHQCDPCRVLLGLDDAPMPSAEFLALPESELVAA